MRFKSLFLTILTAGFALSARGADMPDACALLQPAELLVLGMPQAVSGVARSDDAGTYKACTYRWEGTAADKSVLVATVAVSVPGADRILQFGALLQKALSDNTTEQLQARGEFYAGRLMCKVQLLAPAELSQCIGATATSVVTLAVSRSVTADQVVYPTLQLNLMSKLTARVQAAGG